MKMRGGAFCNELVVRRVSEAAERWLGGRTVGAER